MNVFTTMADATCMTKKASTERKHCYLAGHHPAFRESTK